MKVKQIQKELIQGRLLSGCKQADLHHKAGHRGWGVRDIVGGRPVRASQ